MKKAAIQELTKRIQLRLVEMGYRVDVDGDPGGQTLTAVASALQVPDKEEKKPMIDTSKMVKVETNDPAWDWMNVYIDGEDLVVVNTVATAFGGDSDPMDDGSTASGFSTKGHPDLIACSLPMRHDLIHDKKHGFVLKNSPIPNMPFGLDSKGRDNPSGAHVDLIFSNGLKIDNLPVIDLGPANWTEHGIDLTIAAARKKVANATANNFEDVVSYRVRGAAKYASA